MIYTLKQGNGTGIPIFDQDHPGYNGNPNGNPFQGTEANIDAGIVIGIVIALVMGLQLIRKLNS